MAVWILLALAASAAAAGDLDIAIDTSSGMSLFKLPSQASVTRVATVAPLAGAFNVSVGGQTMWFGIPPSFQFDGATLAFSDGSLTSKSASKGLGEDGFGRCV
jgi:hypothetical protein